MAFITVQPTSNTTPDPGQGGSAVTTPSNTGHASTLSEASGDDVGVTETKTCIWSGVQSVGGFVTSVTLKMTHTSDGTRTGISGTNRFLLQYSLDGGSNWTTAVSRTNMTSSAGPTEFSAALSVSQDLTQLRARDLIEASAIAVGHDATASATISDIKVEVITADSQLIVMM